MLAISSRFPLIQRVEMNRISNTRRKAFQYIGPTMDQIGLDFVAISELPLYRSKHLLFDIGKDLMGVPMQYSDPHAPKKSPKKIRKLTWKQYLLNEENFYESSSDDNDYILPGDFNESFEVGWFLSRQLIKNIIPSLMSLS